MPSSLTKSAWKMPTDEDEEIAVREKLAVQTQNLFQRVTGKAEWKGMRVNTGKTKMLCISDAMSYVPGSFINTSNGKRIAGGGREDSMKLLGFRVSNRPGVAAHVDALKKKFRQRFWVIIHLRTFSFTEQGLVKVYKTVVCPVADYCAPVYHSQLTDEQDGILERQQSHALKLIFGPNISAAKMCEKAGIPTLRQRRTDAVDKFAEKCLSNKRFCKWFPLRLPGRTGNRGGERYLEEHARCDRLKNSPIFYMRRRLNGKEGKSYGERNRKYRDT